MRVLRSASDWSRDVDCHKCATRVRVEPVDVVIVPAVMSPNGVAIRDMERAHATCCECGHKIDLGYSATLPVKIVEAARERSAEK